MTRIAAIIPVGTLDGAKTRLAEALDAEERHDLVEGLLARTVVTALAVDRLDDVLVVSPDREVLRRAADLGARTLRQRSSGLNRGLAEARADVVAGGATPILVLPIDLPFVSVEAVTAVLEALDAAGAAGRKPGRTAPAVVLVTDRHGTGTNALGLRPPGVIDFAFGPGSRERPSGRRRGGRRTVRGGRWRARGRPRHRRRPRLRRIAARRRVSVSADGSIRILALDGIPEVRPGDDLGAFIVNALGRTRGALPLGLDDVLVVTQKVVSKAEGAVVDLTTVTPRREAVAFATKFDRDPRQVEVVLREARRVVRMANGVLITETHARVRVRERGHRRVQRRARDGLPGHAAAGRSGPVRGARSARPSGHASGWTCRS